MKQTRERAANERLTRTMKTENESLKSVATRIEVEGPEIVEDVVKTFIASKIDALVARTSGDDSPHRPNERIATWDLRKRVTAGFDVILSGGDPPTVWTDIYAVTSQHI